mmetsp:Transcript_12429/g.29130  ORF Transcript_12429/g.29130 Transcript_12429/m.29130 type:complete len:203 (-) Transcript_12429:4-612(-)
MVYSRSQGLLLALLALAAGSSSGGLTSLTGLRDHVGQAALAAVVAVEVETHEDTSTTVGVGALLAEAGNLARSLVDAVVLEDSELDLLVLALDLLGLGVGLLLALLATTVKRHGKVVGALLLGEELLILPLLASEDEALVLGGHKGARSDHILEITNSLNLALGLHAEGTGERLHENLRRHSCSADSETMRARRLAPACQRR